MFEIDSDMTIYITRGDVAFFSVTAEDNGERYKFQPGDVVRIKVTQKKNCENVAFQKDFPVLEETETVEILLTEEETKIGDVISKPVDYWYEVELNPYTNPQTIIGYDDDGPKIFKLFPEGRDLGTYTEPEDVPVVDSELSLTSDRPVQNQAVTRAMNDLFGIVKKVSEDGSSAVATMTKKVDDAVNKASKDTERLDSEMAVERARINNLVANTGEQTEGNAELIDIRTGADGTVYETAGEAVRGQVGDLKNDLGNIIPLKWIVNSYVHLDGGGEYEVSTYNSTDYTEINASVPVCVRTKMGSDMSALCYYDENKVFISGLNIPSDTLTETLLDVPSNAKYIRFSCLASVNTSDAYLKYVGVTTEIMKVLASNEKEITDYKMLHYEEPYTAEVTKNEGFYIMASGAIIPLATYFYTDSLVVHCGDKITVTSKDPSGNAVSRISKWTESGVYIETIDFGTKNETASLYVVEKGTEYIRFSGYIANEMNITVQRAVISPVFENAVKSIITANLTNTTNAMYAYSIENVLCIGDSLTSGACYVDGWTGASIDQNYPRYLARMLNCETTNAGRSGWSASDWYRDFIDTYDFASYDAFVIWLGTNYGCGAMPTDAEISAFTPDATVTASEANQALYLIEIIKRIQTANQDAYILLGTCFASKSNVATNNATIASIAEKYGCVLLDMSDLGVANKPELRGNVNNPHFGKAGNIFIADRICKRINEDITANPVRAEFGYTERTN